MAKQIYSAKIFAANIYAAGIWRGVGVTAVVTPPTYFYTLHSSEGIRVGLKTQANFRAEILSTENLRVELRAGQ